MRKVEIINHQGKEICYLNFSYLKDEKEIFLLIEEAKKYIRTKSPKSVYNLSNIEEMHFNSTIKEMFGDFIKGNQHFIKVSAVVGVSGLKNIVFNGIMKFTGREIKAFESIEDAKNWLIIHS